MPREIVIQARRNDEREALETRARFLLMSGTDTGDDDVLDKAIEIASDEGLDVVFRVDGTPTMYTPDLAYRIRRRGLDIRRSPV